MQGVLVKQEGLICADCAVSRGDRLEGESISYEVSETEHVV